MTHSISELSTELRQITESWPQASGETRVELLHRLKDGLDELWHMPGSEALGLRQRFRTFIDEALHDVQHVQRPRAAVQPSRMVN